MSDQLFKKRQQERKKRISKQIAERAETWLIVCEGEKTETQYFKSLVSWANSKSTNELKIQTYGHGENTLTLVKKVDDLISFVDGKKLDIDIPFGKVFVVFDKDSFPDSNFDNAIHKCLSNDYIPIWSNECFELWYILHFQMLDSDIGRETYFRILSTKFGENYKKGDADNYSKLNTDKNLNRARKYANRLLCESVDITSFSKRVPCTNMPTFIDELEEYLNIKL